MIDGEIGTVRLQVAFRDVRLAVAIVDQNAVPRVILGRMGASRVLVPLLRSLKLRIDINDYAPVIEQLVLNNLPYRELRLRAAHSYTRSPLRDDTRYHSDSCAERNRVAQQQREGHRRLAR